MDSRSVPIFALMIFVVLSLFLSFTLPIENDAVNLTQDVILSNFARKNATAHYITYVTYDDDGPFPMTGSDTHYLVLGDGACTASNVATDTDCWSHSSGGAGGAGVPGSSNPVILNGSSGAGTAIQNAAFVSLSFNMTGFTGTWDTGSFSFTSGTTTFDGTFDMNGSVVSLGAVSFLSSSKMDMATATITSTGGYTNASTQTANWTSGTSTWNFTNTNNFTITTSSTLYAASIREWYNVTMESPNATLRLWTLSGDVRMNNLTIQDSGAGTNKTSFSIGAAGNEAWVEGNLSVNSWGTASGTGGTWRVDGDLNVASNGLFTGSAYTNYHLYGDLTVAAGGSSGDFKNVYLLGGNQVWTNPSSVNAYESVYIRGTGTKSIIGLLDVIGNFQVDAPNVNLMISAGGILSAQNQYGTFILDGGSPETPVVLRSSVPGSQWFFTWGAANPTEIRVRNLSVQDSNADMTVITCEVNCNDLGNNDGWIFPVSCFSESTMGSILYYLVPILIGVGVALMIVFVFLFREKDSAGGYMSLTIELLCLIVLAAILIPAIVGFATLGC